MKYTAIILITLLLAFSSATAQTSAPDGVLAEGGEPLTQSMVDRLVGFFEWSLEVEFSPAQRAEFQKELVESWKNGDCREIRGVEYVLEFTRELDHFDESERRQAQILIRERFLRELEYRSSNRINALLLASYREKHGRVDNLSTAVKQ